MKESAFQGYVTDVFKRNGWTVKHAPTPMRPVSGGKFVPDSRGRGLLDLTMTHPDPPRLVIAEIKNEDGELSDAQREHLFALRAVAQHIRDGWTPNPEAPSPVPFAVYVFQPGNEPLIEAVARGATVRA